MLSVANKPIMLIVVILSVVAPSQHLTLGDLALPSIYLIKLRSD
jgi:hypothetical protein